MAAFKVVAALVEVGALPAKRTREEQQAYRRKAARECTRRRAEIVRQAKERGESPPPPAPIGRPQKYTPEERALGPKLYAKKSTELAKQRASQGIANLAAMLDEARASSQTCVQNPPNCDG